jgi:putative redox protein
VRLRTVALVYQGGETFSGKTGTGRSYMFGDVLAKNEYSPVETVVASLAACTGMDVISILVKKRQVVERYEIEARALQRTEYPQVLTEIEIVHVVEGPVVLEHAVRRAIELSATKYCPVNAMLSAGATEINHRYRMHCTGLNEKRAEGSVVVTGPFRPPDVVE